MKFKITKKILKKILEFADTINKVDTDNIDETIGINENYNVFRKDEIISESDKDELLANAQVKMRECSEYQK